MRAPERSLEEAVEEYRARRRFFERPSSLLPFECRATVHQLSVPMRTTLTAARYSFNVPSSRHISGEGDRLFESQRTGEGNGLRGLCCPAPVLCLRGEGV